MLENFYPYSNLEERETKLKVAKNNKKMALSSKRARAASDTKPSSKKFKSAKDVSAEASIAVDVPEQKSTDDKEPFWEVSVE